MPTGRNGRAAKRAKAVAARPVSRLQARPPASTNRRLVTPDGTGHWRLRIWHTKPKPGKMARVLVKCGDCDQQLEIFYDGQSLEINGVMASIEEWSRVLGPLLELRRRIKGGQADTDSHSGDSGGEDSDRG